MPEAREAYRTFAIHSGDTETGYRRDESWETTTFRLADWDDAEAQALWNEFDKVEKAPAAINQGCANAGLLKELKPWLDEFNKLGTRGKKAIELGRIYREGKDDAGFWNKYVQNLMTPEGRAAYEAHKSGTMKLQPFYDNLMDDMGDGFLIKMVGHMPQMYKGVGSFRNAGTTLTKLMFDNDSTTFYTSGMSQKKDDWIGVDLGSVIDVKEINILQGRNSVDDVDYLDHAALQYSADGQNWTTLIDDMQKQYVINWKGEQPVQARYVRLLRLDSKKQNYAAVRTFDVNPLRLDNIGFAIDSTDPETLYAFDKRLATTYANQGTLSFEVAPGAKGYTLLMGQPAAGTTLKQLDKDGQVIAETTLDAPFAQIEVAEGAAKVQLDGTVEITGHMYTIQSNGTTVGPLVCDGITFPVSAGDAVRYRLDGSELSKMYSLTDVRLNSVSSSEAVASNNQKFNLENGVQVYERRYQSGLGTQYYLTSIDQVSGGDYTLTGWYDKAESEGGRMRVIVAVAK